MAYFELETSLKPVDYFIAKDVNEAINYLREYKNTKVICGGTIIYDLAVKGLIPRVDRILDIEQAGLDYIKDDKDMIHIGATATLMDIQNHERFKQEGAYDALRDSVQGIPVQIMNVGTVGGEICSSVSYCDLPLAALALDANVIAVGSTGERVIPFEEFCLEFFVTSLKDDEIMTEIQIPHQPPRTGSAFEKLTFMHQDYSIVNSAARITLDTKDNCKESRVIISSNLNLALRFRKAEEILNGSVITEEIIQKAAEAASTEFKPLSDTRASAEYRKKVSKHMCEKAIRKAFERTGK